MHGDRLADNKAISDEFTDRLAGVGIGDFVDFIRIEPNLALSTACNRGSEAFLSSQVDPVRKA